MLIFFYFILFIYLTWTLQLNIVDAMQKEFIAIANFQLQSMVGPLHCNSINNLIVTIGP